MKQILALFTWLLMLGNTYSQKIVAETDAVAMALKTSRNISAAELSILQQKQLLKSSYNLPNTEVFIESPTGNFYTPSITQSFEFPTVYKKQYILQKQKIVLAENEKNLTENELKFQVKQLYLLLQYAVSVQQQLLLQDTVYELISKSSGRQFDAGQIDFLQKTMAEAEYGEIHKQFIQAQLSLTNLQKQLQYITGSQEVFMVAALPLNTMPNDAFALIDSAAIATSPSMLISNQASIISQKNIDLQKAKSLPGLALGYFNQGEKGTPIANRFRFGFTLPLWFAQYKSNIAAAKTEREINLQKTAGLQQQIMFQLLEAKNEFSINHQNLQYYQNTGIKKANEIIATAKRFFESGQNDYINYLRNINEAYAVQLKYLEAIKNYRQSILSIQYLTGKL